MRSLHRWLAAPFVAAILASISSPALSQTPPPGAWPPPGVTPLPPPADTPAAPAAPPAPAAPVAEQKAHGPRTPGVLVMVLGAAGLGSGAVFGAIAMSTGAAARAQCAGNLCPPSAAPDISKTKDFEAASYAAFTAGGVIAATGLVLAIVAPGKPTDSARVTPWVGPSSAGIGFSGRF